MDGSFLGFKKHIHKNTCPYEDRDNPAFNVYRNNHAAHIALLAAQLVVAANNLAPGGSLLLRLDMLPDEFKQGTLALLRRCFRWGAC